mgnify:FL=1
MEATEEQNSMAKGEIVENESFKLQKLQPEELHWTTNFDKRFGEKSKKNIKRLNPRHPSPLRISIQKGSAL